jgi:hypothetical protein
VPDNIARSNSVLSGSCGHSTNNSAFTVAAVYCNSTIYLYDPCTRSKFDARQSAHYSSRSRLITFKFHHLTALFSIARQRVIAQVLEQILLLAVLIACLTRPAQSESL